MVSRKTLASIVRTFVATGKQVEPEDDQKEGNGDWCHLLDEPCPHLEPTLQPKF